MTHRLSLRSIEPVTHDTYRLRFVRPTGYDFTPGQATDLALDRDGWREEARPFTFTSLPEDDYLEFTIKSYPSHEGVTAEIARMERGDTVLIGEPWGAIEDRGPGIFIAGGAGITPFIAILRARAAREGWLEGCRLIFSNKTEADIILRAEWEAMPGLDCVFVLEEEDKPGFPHGRIDAAFLDERVSDFSGTFYLCGPPPMEEALTGVLRARGVEGDRLVTEG